VGAAADVLGRQRFTTRGATWAIYGGLIPCLVLVVFSPIVSGNAAAIVCRRT
jgi:cation/acetate symporter